MKTVFGNNTNRRRFTQALAEMVCKKKFDLAGSLKIISSNNSFDCRIIALASKNIYEAMLSGLTFSDALQLCPYIDFDSVYISFVRFAERCGTLEQTLIFLKEKCEREQDNRNKVLQASVYPAFVIILAICAGVFFLFLFYLIAGRY